MPFLTNRGIVEATVVTTCEANGRARIEETLDAAGAKSDLDTLLIDRLNRVCPEGGDHAVAVTLIYSTKLRGKEVAEHGRDK